MRVVYLYLSCVQFPNTVLRQLGRPLSLAANTAAQRYGGLWGAGHGAVGLSVLITPDEPRPQDGLKKNTESRASELRKWTSPKIPVFLMVRRDCKSSGA